MCRLKPQYLLISILTFAVGVGVVSLAAALWRSALYTPVDVAAPRLDRDPVIFEAGPYGDEIEIKYSHISVESRLGNTCIDITNRSAYLFWYHGPTAPVSPPREKHDQANWEISPTPIPIGKTATVCFPNHYWAEGVSMPVEAGPARQHCYLFIALDGKSRSLLPEPRVDRRRWHDLVPN